MSKFLYFLVINAIIISLSTYVYGENIFTSFILVALLAIIPTAGLGTSDKIPFLLIAIMFCALLAINSYLSSYVVDWASSFYEPTLLWKILLSVSFPIGILHGIGRYGNGYRKREIESLSNLSLLALIIVAFVIGWWEGGVAYLVIRICLMTAEISMANTILYYASVGRRGSTETEM